LLIVILDTCRIIYRVGFGSKTVSFAEQSLPNYFKTLKLSDCNDFLESEKEFQRHGFRVLDDHTI
jgi:hypothetical protein